MKRTSQATGTKVGVGCNQSVVPESILKESKLRTRSLSILGMLLLLRDRLIAVALCREMGPATTEHDGAALGSRRSLKERPTRASMVLQAEAAVSSEIGRATGKKSKTTRLKIRR
jgi:hypothetical protein